MTDDFAGGLAAPFDDGSLMTEESLEVLSGLLGTSIRCTLLAARFEKQSVFSRNLLLVSTAPVQIGGRATWPDPPAPAAVWLRLEPTAETKEYDVERLTASSGVPLHKTLGLSLDDLSRLPAASIDTGLEHLNFVRCIDIYQTDKRVEHADFREPNYWRDADVRIEFHGGNLLKKVRFALEFENVRGGAFRLEAHSAGPDEVFPASQAFPDATLRRSLRLAEAREAALSAFVLRRG